MVNGLSEDDLSIGICPLLHVLDFHCINCVVIGKVGGFLNVMIEWVLPFVYLKQVMNFSSYRANSIQKFVRNWPKCIAIVS